MNLGAEPKKVAILAGIVVAGVAYYVSSSADSTSASSPRVVPISASNDAVTAAPPTRSRTGGRLALSEIRPRVGGTRPDDKVDPATIDPELRLDLLAKIQKVEPIEAGRNLFQFGAAPAPLTPIPPIPTGVPHIDTKLQPPPQSSLNAAKSTLPSTPQAPPINLKYYGYEVSKADGHKEAFLLDGDDIMLVTENETVKQRYKIVRIALTSIVIEDTQSKSTQTLALQEIPS
jgi:hypothetical protein